MRLMRLVSQSVDVVLGKENRTLNPLEQADQRGCPLVDRIHGPSQKRLRVMRAAGCVMVVEKDAGLSDADCWRAKSKQVFLGDE